MIRRKVNSIVLWLIRSGAVEESDYELYEYAIYSLFFSWSPLLLAIIFGIIMDIPLKSILMIIPFMAIRKYSGGYHAKHAGVCFGISCGLMISFLAVLKYAEMSFAVDILVSLSVVLIVIASPVDSENKRLSEDEIHKFKWISTIISVMTLAIYWLLKQTGKSEYAICFGASLLLTAILLLPCFISELKV